MEAYTSTKAVNQMKSMTYLTWGRIGKCLNSHMPVIATYAKSVYAYYSTE